MDEPDFISRSRKVIRDTYLPFIDNGDIIQNYIEQDIETAYDELAGELGDVILEIEKKTEDKNKLTGSGKTTNTKTNRRNK